MMNIQVKPFWLGSMFSLLLASCGGGGSGEEDSVLPPGLNITPDFCGDQVTTAFNLIGNNMYEFMAQAEGCFGMKSDGENLKKASVPLEIIFPVTDEISVTPSARLVSAKDGFDTWFYFAFEVTNESQQLYCNIYISGSEVVEASGIHHKSLSSGYLWGDLYADALGNSYDDSCIPPGETRTYYDSFVDQESTYDATDVAKLVFKKVKGSPQDPDFFSPRSALMAQEFTWQSQAVFNTGYNFDLLSKMDFVNPGPGAITLENDYFQMVYLDEQGYPLFIRFAYLFPESSLELPEGAHFDVRYGWEGLDIRYHYTLFGRASRVRVQLGKWMRN